MSERLRCCVPFCRRTRKNVDPHMAEWICGDHWRLLDLRHRRVYGRYTRHWRRFGADRNSEAVWRIWCWIKRKAIERAMGITG